MKCIRLTSNQKLMLGLRYFILNPSNFSVVIAIAMKEEATPFVEHLGLALDEKFFQKEAPFKAYRGSYESCAVTVVTNGQDNVYGKNQTCQSI